MRKGVCMVGGGGERGGGQKVQKKKLNEHIADQNVIPHMVIVNKMGQDRHRL